MPIHSEEHLPPRITAAAGTELSRASSSSLVMIAHSMKELYKRHCPSSLTRYCWIELSPIVQDSPLLPPAGVQAIPTRYAPVRHFVLNSSHLLGETSYLYLGASFPSAQLPENNIRLACVKHIASVPSEPESNSSFDYDLALQCLVIDILEKLVKSRQTLSKEMVARNGFSQMKEVDEKLKMRESSQEREGEEGNYGRRANPTPNTNPIELASKLRLRAGRERVSKRTFHLRHFGMGVLPYLSSSKKHFISLGQLQERPMKEPTSDTKGRYGDGAARTKTTVAGMKDCSRTELCCLLGPDGGTGIFGGKKAAPFFGGVGQHRFLHQGKGPRLYTATEAESKGLVERSLRLWATTTWVEKRPLNIIWTDRGYNMGLGLLMAAFASLHGLRAKALDPLLNPPTVRLSVLLSLKTTEDRTVWDLLLRALEASNQPDRSRSKVYYLTKGRVSGIRGDSKTTNATISLNCLGETLRTTRIEDPPLVRKHNGLACGANGDLRLQEGKRQPPSREFFYCMFRERLPPWNSSVIKSWEGHRILLLSVGERDNQRRDKGNVTMNGDMC
nr:hypothetical protein [Tanacetum cinerariifolium]